VRKTSIVLAATCVFALAATIHAQRGGRGGFDMAAINTTLPLEGAPLAVPGSYEVKGGPAAGTPGHVAYHPADLSAFPARDTMPLVVWGNGGCAINSDRYAGFLTTIASHGFLVMATAAQPGAERGRATADDLRGAIAWAEAENARAGSPLNGKIALDEIAVMGQSCGGFMSLELGADPRVDTIGVFNSGVQGDNFAQLEALHGPVLIIDGHDRDFASEWARATFAALDSQPTFYGSRHGAGHTATVDHPGGGEYANVASSWARWQLKGDKTAAMMFVGENCELCTKDTWDTDAKNLQ
jgi:dienelactone hydrolase